MRQMQPIAEAGFTAVAFDQRGYGQSSRIETVTAYSSDEHCADLLAILANFKAKNAVFIGHDFGAPLVWNMAVRHPEKCRAIIPISCPYDFDLAGRNGESDTFTSALIKPSEVFAQIAQQHFIHLHYFQKKGLADKELADNAREFLMRIYWALSAKGSLLDWVKYPSAGTGYLDVLDAAPKLPWAWMSEQDFDDLVAAYQAQGKDDAFLAGLNNYRVADINWAIGAQYTAASIGVKTLFISGEADPVLQMVGDKAIEYMRDKVAELDVVFIEKAGHFVQLEQTESFNKAVVSFLQRL